MKLPRAGSAFERVIFALWENNGPMRVPDLAIAAKCSVDIVMGCGTDYDLRTMTAGIYELGQSYVTHLNRLKMRSAPQAELQIAQPRVGNFLTKPMTGYEASIRRGMRAA